MKPQEIDYNSEDHATPDWLKTQTEFVSFYHPYISFLIKSQSVMITHILKVPSPRMSLTGSYANYSI